MGLRATVLIALLVVTVMMLSGCASLQEDGGRDFDAAWPEVTEAGTRPLPGAISTEPSTGSP